MAIVGIVAKQVAKGVAKEVTEVLSEEVAKIAAQHVADSANAIDKVFSKIFSDGSGYITSISVSNETAGPLQVSGNPGSKEYIIHGKYIDKDMYSTGVVQPGQTDVFGHQASAGFYGSEGSIAYQCQQADGRKACFVVGWDNVYKGDNHVITKFDADCKPFTNLEIDRSERGPYSITNDSLLLTAAISNDEKCTLSITIGYVTPPSNPQLKPIEEEVTSSSIGIQWNTTTMVKSIALIDESGSTDPDDFTPMDSIHVPSANTPLTKTKFDNLKPDHTYSMCVVSIGNGGSSSVSDIIVKKTKPA